MKWFPFQGIMLHAADNNECPEEHLKFMLKVFSMFKIRVIYYENVHNKYVPEDVGIMSINCVKFIGCLLDNKKI